MMDESQLKKPGEQPGTDEDVQTLQEVRQAVRNQSISRYMVEAVLDSYLLQLARSDLIAVDRIMGRIEQDEQYARLAHRAIYDGLAFSTFVGTLSDEAYIAALEELDELGEQELETMRAQVFTFGVGVACQTLGGSPSHGKTKLRCDQFKQALDQ